MSKTIYLDPSKTAPLEPSEGDARNGFWISPFEVPRAVYLHCETGFRDVRAVKFTYPGGEKGDEWTQLDEYNDPPILVRRAQYSEKILQLTFGYPVTVEQLVPIGDRLIRRAASIKMMAARFNYQMIAAIFQNWQEVLEPAQT